MNRPFSRLTRSSGGICDDIAVKPTRSAKATVTSAKPSAIRFSPPRSRLAIGAGKHVQQQLLVLAVLVLDDDILGVDLVDHAVERRAQRADLIAGANRHFGTIVAGGKARHAGGKLAQRREQRARQPGAGQDHHQQRDRAGDHQVLPQLVDRCERLVSVDLGDQRPFGAWNCERPPMRQGSAHRDSR